MHLATFAADALKKMDESAGEGINIRGVSNTMDAATNAFLADCMEGQATDPSDLYLEGETETAQDDAAINRDQPYHDAGGSEVVEGDNMNDNRLTSTPKKRRTSRAERLAHARKVKAQKARSKKKGLKAGKANKRVLKYWTKEEEASLLIALEALGARWSKIVRQYGEGGSVDESLKGRDSMCLLSKACHMKKKMLEMGREIPKCLEGVAVKGQPQGERLARRPRKDSEVDERRPARRGRGRPPKSTLQSGDHTAASAVKTEVMEVFSDDEEEADASEGWQDLPSSTPKTKAKRGRPARNGGQQTQGNDIELTKLRIEAARAVEVEAAATRNKLEAAFRVQQYEREHGYADGR